MAVIKQLPQTYDIRLFATFYAYGRNLFYLLNNSRMTDFEEYFKICSLWLYWVFVVVRGLTLVAVSGVYSLFAVNGLLIVVASPVAERGLRA